MRDAFDELKGMKVTVFGLSTDSVGKQKKFRESKGLPYDLISDPKGVIARKLGIPLVMGKFTSRRAQLFQDGKLVWVDEKGATDSQGADVLKAIAAAK